MRTTRSILIAGVVMFSAAAARAQYRVGPVYPEKPEPEFLQRIPQSGYDPFKYNAWSGRYDYVPIPYEPEPWGANYNPFRFNWHSGRWDYVPFPSAYDRPAYPMPDHGGGNASNFVDTRVYRRSAYAPPPEPPRPPVQIAPPPPPPRNLLPERLPAPATQPASTTRPSIAQTARRDEMNRPAAAEPSTVHHDGLERVRGILGRWEYDYATGRWRFVLPPG